MQRVRPRLSPELRAVLVLSGLIIAVATVHLLYGWGFRAGVRAACDGRYAVGIDRAGREVIVPMPRGTEDRP